jgi:hypothetical protein
MMNYLHYKRDLKLRRATDAGRWAGLNECAFNRLCACGRGSSAPTRFCLDARICSLSLVSFGLEPAPDGSGRCAHLLRRDGSFSTTTPSTSTVTSCTECRPHQRPARCRRDSRVQGRSIIACPGRRAHVCVKDCSCSPVAVHLAVRRPAAGRCYRATLRAGARCALIAGVVTAACWPLGRTAAATVVRAGARCAPIAGVVASPLTASGPRLLSWREPMLPDRRGCPLTVCRPAGRVVPATAIRAGGSAP